jgi:hypothetical protein
MHVLLGREVVFAYDPSSYNVLSILGAMFDIFGAALLARALVFVKARALMRQSTSAWGGISIPLIKMFSDQWSDGAFGLSLLVIGFSIQGAVGCGVKSTNFAVFATGTMALSGILLAWVLLRRRLTEWKFKRASRTMRKAGGAPMWSEQEIDSNWEAEAAV